MKFPLPSLILALGAAVLTLAPAQAQVKGDAQAGAARVAMCVGCHGIIDYKTAFPEVYHVPRIAGQNAKYMVVALESYRSGDRKHPSMRGIAGALSEQDMADVAAYYEALGGAFRERTLPEPAKPSAAVGKLLEKGGCVSCHGNNFSSPIDPSYPRLAGQFPDYLFVALKSYRDNTHSTWGRGNPVMASMAKQFSNTELRAMADYIGSLPGQVETVTEPRFGPLDRNVDTLAKDVEREVK